MRGIIGEKYIVDVEMRKMKLERDFYMGETLDVGKALLGKIVVSNIGGKCVKGRIVEM